MIELTSLSKSHQSRKVLDIDAFTFEAGVRYALIGPNGAGKTTLLRILAGVLRADTGAVQMPDELKKELGYMPQHPYSFGFSVLKNVQIAFKDQKAAKGDALAALEKVGMGGFAAAKGNRLSGGEAQRMAMARMIAKPRLLLLLDEPTSSTDIAGNEMIQTALAGYCAETGCTLIFATHSPAQVQALADVAVMIDEGRIIEWGPARQILFNPAQPATKAFLRHWQLAPENGDNANSS